MRKERRKSKNPGEQSTAEPVARTVAVSRPVGKGEDTAELVRRLGWTPFIFHTVELKPLGERQIKDQVSTCLSEGPFDWIVFMSSSGAHLVFNALMSHPRMQDAQLKTNLLAVGPKTRETLVRLGATGIQVPEKYGSDGINEFFSRLPLKDSRVALIRSSAADDSLANTLKSRNALVTTLNAYESNVPQDLENTFRLLEGLSRGLFSAVLFTSAVSVSNLFKIAATKFDENQLTRLLKRTLVGAIGPATAEQLERRGIDPVVPEEYLIESALKKLFSYAIVA